jgi:hypothetical protein
MKTKTMIYNSSVKPNMDTKVKALKASSQAKHINFDSLPQT